MRILLSFLPFFAFGFIVGAVPMSVACLIAAGLGLAITLGDHLLRGRSIKLLDAGTVLVFGGLALIAAALYPALSPSWVWVVVDAGLLTVALVSLGIRRPFTLQYAREQTGPELWDNPVFLAVNDRITAIWSLAFAVMVFAQLAVIYLPAMPAWADITGSVLPAILALAFTTWYPAHVRQRHSAAPSSAM